MPKLPVTAEPADWKEYWITLTYAAETSTRAFANDVQEWEVFCGSVNIECTSATWPDSADHAIGKNAIFT